MKQSVRIWGILAGITLAVWTGWPAAAPADKAKDQAKVYEAALESLRGQPYGKAIAQVEEWKFEGLDSWETADPTWDFVRSRNRSKIKFSKDEFKIVFSPAGTYKVAIYNLLVGKDTSHLGEIDGMGRGIMKDQNINLEQFCVIRLVFRDGFLVDSRIWPKVDQSSFSGGSVIIR